MINIVIINTHCSNLLSVKNMIRKLGYDSIISDNANIISKADKIFLPGIGTASTAMKQLKKKNLVQCIQNCTQPILGICLGMQLFGAESEESKGIETLKIINVHVKKMQFSKLPIPHMGWNNIIIMHNDPLLHGITKHHYFYFSHSFYIKLCKSTIAYTNYGIPFSSIIKYKNYIGVQFHPEKSSTSGKKLIKNFLEI